MTERELYIACQQLIRSIDLGAATDEIYMQVIKAGTLHAFHIHPPEQWLPQAIVSAALVAATGNLKVAEDTPAILPPVLEVAV